MEKKLVHLVFPQHLIKEPAIWKIGKEFEVVTNIRRANVTKEFGWVDLELDGEIEEIEKAMDYLKEKGVGVSPIERDIVE
jgi:ABC-type methionine transport system ATPase subunit